MVKTRSQCTEAAPLCSDNDGRQSFEEEKPQSSDEEDLANNGEVDPTRTKLQFAERLAEENPYSTHHPHAVCLTRKKPDDPPSRRRSSTPSPQSNSVNHSQVQDVACGISLQAYW